MNWILSSSSDRKGGNDRMIATGEASPIVTGRCVSVEQVLFRESLVHCLVRWSMVANILARRSRYDYGSRKVDLHVSQ
jgi:hypothetical protein